jgi:MYXO-CTERM domain-containing protein
MATMWRDAKTVAVADGAGLLLVLTGLVLLRNADVAPSVRGVLVDHPLPWMLGGGVLLAATALRRRRSRSAIGAALVFAEDQRAWQRAVMENGGGTIDRHPRSGLAWPLAGVVLGTTVGFVLGEPGDGTALGVAAGLLGALLLAPLGEGT